MGGRGGGMESITQAIPKASTAGAAAGQGEGLGSGCPKGHCHQLQARPRLLGVCLQQLWRQFQG